MNAQKLIAIAVAIAINCAVLAWFHSWGAAAAASAAVSPATAGSVITLPTITVRPSAEQLRALRRERAATAPAQANVSDDYSATSAMPYYSFAAQQSDSTQG